MAPAVGRLWITANGAAVDGMAGLLDAVPNASVTDAPMGEGWAQAVLASLQEAPDAPACRPTSTASWPAASTRSRRASSGCVPRSWPRTTGSREHVKWNAPSFCYAGVDRVTFRLQPGNRLQLVLHRGAKVRDDAADFRFEDPTRACSSGSPPTGPCSPSGTSTTSPRGRAASWTSSGGGCAA